MTAATVSDVARNSTSLAEGIILINVVVAVLLDKFVADEDGGDEDEEDDEEEDRYAKYGDSACTKAFPDIVVETKCDTSMALVTMSITMCNM